MPWRVATVLRGGRKAFGMMEKASNLTCLKWEELFPDSTEHCPYVLDFAHMSARPGFCARVLDFSHVTDTTPGTYMVAIPSSPHLTGALMVSTHLRLEVTA